MHLQQVPPVLAKTGTAWENDGSAQVKGAGNNKNAGITRNEGFTIKLSEFGDNPPAHKMTTVSQDMI